MSTQKGNILLPLISAVAIVAVLAAGYFFYSTSAKAPADKQNQQLQKASGNQYPTNNNQANSPSPTTQNETANWKAYNLNLVVVKLPPDYVVKKSEVEFPPKGLWAIHFEANSLDYSMEIEPMGIAGGNINGMSFFLDAHDYVKASRENPAAGTPKKVEDDLKSFDASPRLGTAKSDSCTILETSSRKFIVCYFTGRNIFNGGTWWAKMYESPYAYEFSLNAQTEERETSRTLLGKILSTFKFN